MPPRDAASVSTPLHVSRPGHRSALASIYAWIVVATISGNAFAELPPKRHSKPEWLFEGYLSVQAMEGSGLRRGFATVETPQNIARRRDPNMADRLQKQGVRFVILAGPMGAGVTNERDKIVGNKELAAALKAKGIRRVLYVQTIGSIFYESFFAETPRAVDWVQRLPSGETPTYYTQWFRYIPCLNNDEFVTYLKDELRSVMQELDLDGVFTDNYGYYSYSCQCEHCQKKFRSYLNRKYPDAASRQARFETPATFDFVKPPPFKTVSYGAAHILIPDDYPIVDPVSQEWIRFRCERLGEVTRELNAVVKKANPQAIWFLNYLYGGTPGLNNAAFHGAWPETVYPHADLISAEVAGPPQLHPKGAAQGRALMMKVAKNFGIPLSTFSGYGPLSGWKRLYLAEGLAFNAAPMDLCGDIVRDEPPDWMRRYVNFYPTHRDVAGKAATVVDCAVLHNFETLSYFGSYPHESLQLCEQSLLQGGVTFDIIFDRDLQRLDKYRCLFLANVVAMSQSTAEKIAAYVRAGGSIVVTDDTSALNEKLLPWRGGWLEPRKTHRLAELLGVEWPRGEVLLKEVEKGRVAVIPAVNRPWSSSSRRGQADQERAPLSRSLVHHSEGPAMPAILAVEGLSHSHGAILKAVDFALDGSRTVRLTTAGAVVPEVTSNAKGIHLHLVNWNEAKPVQQIKVSLRIPPGKSIQKVELRSPDPETKSETLRFQTRDGRIEFTVPNLVCYDLVTAH